MCETMTHSNYQALYHEPLARVIAQALPVFDIKLAFTFFLPLVFSSGRGLIFRLRGSEYMKYKK